jgi:chromosome segregation ATPase
MSDEREDHEEDSDKSITEALSTLGWVEEQEEEQESLESEDNIKEQLTFFMEENKRLINEIAEKTERIQNLEQSIQNLSEKAEEDDAQSEQVQKLYETIENKNEIIDKLNSTLEEDSTKLNKIIQDQIEKIKDLTSQVENLQSEQKKSQDLNNKLEEKEIIIKELKEQLQYLENDSIQKSKFEKVEVLLEKKDEIITEKEKTIFSLENDLKTAKQKIHDLQQQFETFNLVKKDLEKKIDRNKALAMEIEELKQKNITNQDIVERLEEKLEDAHKKSGNLTGKFELELANMRSMIEDKGQQIKSLTEQLKELQNKPDESKQIEEKFLKEIQDIKDEKLKLESEIITKSEEIIELKKKIKLMRRDLQKS